MTKDNKQLTCNQVASVLKISRSMVDRLQLKSEITPIETVEPRFMFDSKEIYELKSKRENQ